jgi:LacI family transcriptional regulator
MPHQVTIKDVAALAQVSLGTVSNVLNRPDKVSSPTRDRVLAVIEELGFIRNAGAGQLRGQRSRALGLVVLDVANPFFTEMARGVEDAANDVGYVTILCNSDGSRSKERRYLDLLEEQRVEGLLITPVSEDLSRLQELRARGLAVVLLDRRGIGDELCSVSVDDIEGGRLAAQHLFAMGHPRLTYVTGPMSITQCADRFSGVLLAARQAGVHRKQVRIVETAALTVTAGRLAADRILAGKSTHSAVFCANDLLALGLMSQFHRNGLRTPDDVAVIGYDDVELAADASTPLTSVRQPKQKLGSVAARLLLDEANPQHVHQQVVFQPELVVRASSGPH